MIVELKDIFKDEPGDVVVEGASVVVLDEVVGGGVVGTTVAGNERS